MEQRPETLGIIAGSKSLPLELAANARSAGVARIVAIAFKGETHRRIEEVCDEVTWLNVGQMQALVDNFKKANVSKCVMAGQIAPWNLFRLRPDSRARSLLSGLEHKNAHTIFGAIAEDLARDAIELISAVPWLASLMPGPGYRMGPASSDAQLADARYAFDMAKEISRLEIGQTVVVKEGTVLAVEGFEGTYACLKRGGKLAGRAGGALAAKVAKKNHELELNIPCVGSQTIKTCAAHGINTIVIEADRTLLLERNQLETLATKKAISLLSLA